MKNIVFILFILPFSVFSQPDPIKWKKVPKEDLKMTVYDEDMYAPAVILCDYGQMYFDDNMGSRNLFLFYKRHVRIKILNEEGLKYAKAEILFHDMVCERYPTDNTQIFKASTYNLMPNGEVKVSKMKTRNITYRDSTDCTRIAELSFPDVKVGSVIDYTYSIPSLDLINPKDWYFQTDIPIIHSEFRARIPLYFEYLFLPKDIEKFDIYDQKYFNESLVVTVNRANRRGYGNLIFNMSGTEYQFVIKNLPANTSEFNNIEKKIKVHLKRVEQSSEPGWQRLTYALMITTDPDYNSRTPGQRKLLSYPAGFIAYYLPTWDEMNENLLKSKKFGIRLAKNWDYKRLLDKILGDTDTKKEKMIAIYNYIKNNIKWNGKNSIYVSKSLEKIAIARTNRKTTPEFSSSEINFLLMFLLKKAGIKTAPLLISTQNIDLDLPGINQFNTVIAYSEIDNRKFYLDATDKTESYNTLDLEHFYNIGYCVRLKDHGWKAMKSDNLLLSKTQTLINLNIENDFSITGDIEKKFYGKDVYKTRTKISKTGEKSLCNEYLNNPDFSFTEIKHTITDHDSDSLPLVLKIDVQKPASGANDLKIKPVIKSRFSRVPFNETAENNEANFKYPLYEEHKIKIRIPENCKVKFHKPVELNIVGGGAYFHYNVTKLKNELELNVIIKINKTKFTGQEYHQLFDFFMQIEETLNKEILITQNN